MKRMQTGFSILLVSSLTLGLVACKKDKKEVNLMTKEKISGTYFMTSMMYKEGTSTPINLIDYMDDCSKDDLTILQNDNAYILKDAGAKCNPPNDYQGVWELKNSNTIVVDGEEYTIKSFDGDKLVLFISYNGGGMTEEITISLDKQ